MFIAIHDSCQELTSFIMDSTTPGGFTWFLNTCQDSYYLDEDLAKQRDSRNLPDRIREIEWNDDELADARVDADDTRRKTKRIVKDLQDSTTKTGDAVYNHDDFDCATSGNFQTQTSPKDSLGQAPSYQVANPSAKRTLWGKLGDLLSRSNMSHKRESLPVAPLRFVDQCSECHDLRESYGKTRIEDLILSMKNGCDLCGVVLAVLEEYCHALQPRARVRLFAPFQPGSTLTLWCQGEIGTMGSIPFLIEVYVPLGRHSLSLNGGRTWTKICRKSLPFSFHCRGTGNNRRHIICSCDLQGPIMAPNLQGATQELSSERPCPTSN